MTDKLPSRLQTFKYLPNDPKKVNFQSNVWYIIPVSYILQIKDILMMMRWAGSVTLIRNNINIHRILKVKPEGKEQL